MINDQKNVQDKDVYKLGFSLSAYLEVPQIESFSTQNGDKPTLSLKTVWVWRKIWPNRITMTCSICENSKKKYPLKVFIKYKSAVTFDPQNVMSCSASLSRSKFASNWTLLWHCMRLRWPLTSQNWFSSSFDRHVPPSDPFICIWESKFKPKKKNLLMRLFLRYSAQTGGQHRDRSPPGLAIRRTLRAIPGRTNWLQQIMSSL